MIECNNYILNPLVRCVLTWCLDCRQVANSAGVECTSKDYHKYKL